MNKVQSFSVENWKLVGSSLGGEIVLSYLDDSAEVVLGLYAILLDRSVNDVITSHLTKLRKGFDVQSTASGKFYANSLLWQIITDSLSDGSYRSYLFTEYNNHCVVGCATINNDNALIVYQRDLKQLLRSIAMSCLLNENATLVVNDVFVTVYSQTDVVVNENSNADALFFLNDERYLVFYPTSANQDSFSNRASELIKSLFDDHCTIQQIEIKDSCAKYFVSKDGSASYCTYAEVQYDDDVTISLLAHDKVNREMNPFSEFRIEVVNHAV